MHGPSGILSTLESGETQFVLGTELAADVWTIAGEGVAAGRIQVEDLAGGTLVNDHPITGHVEAEYPASVEVGEVTLVVEQKSEDSSQAATLVQAIAENAFCPVSATRARGIVAGRAKLRLPCRPIWR